MSNSEQLQLTSMDRYGLENEYWMQCLENERVEFGVELIAAMRCCSFPPHSHGCAKLPLEHGFHYHWQPPPDAADWHGACDGTHTQQQASTLPFPAPSHAAAKMAVTWFQWPLSRQDTSMTEREWKAAIAVPLLKRVSSESAVQSITAQSSDH